jgi:hypothetical protein
MEEVQVEAHVEVEEVAHPTDVDEVIDNGI